jgi:hypothetical protein
VGLRRLEKSNHVNKFGTSRLHSYERNPIVVVVQKRGEISEHFFHHRCIYRVVICNHWI